ncbi:MAG: FAD-dependent oxidoreductase [Dehalococcoidia bacterium]|nr:FAD-dependent oxidoreductase [Dehalococcoidia bacterium]
MDKQDGNGTVGAVLVVGGGIGGIQTSLDLAESGYYVYLVERTPSIGGVMAQLDKTFPTNDCSMCILSPKLVECGRHLNIELLTYSELLDIKGRPGNFIVSVKKKARFVDGAKCTGCGLCAQGCPVTMKNEYDQGLVQRKAIYTPFLQSVPNTYVIDRRADRPCKAACSDACPIHMNIQGYARLIADGKIKEAYDLIRSTNPLPIVCGRVCYAPCEKACNRAQMDDSIAIRELKRFVTDQIDIDAVEVPEITRNGRKIAIIGSGPAGLAAAHDLALAGYEVTIFEAMPEPGGMLRVGIPEYRLPKAILNKEIDYIRRLGVEIRTNSRIGEDIQLEALRTSHEAVFIATGAHGGTKLDIPGGDSPQVINAIDFLWRANMGEEVELGQRVAVVGGGNTAVDAARVARRLGSDVKVIYRRSRDEMPATPSEVRGAEEEGIEMVFLTNPTGIIIEGGRTSGMECVRMELGEPDASGRRRPVAVPGSEFMVDVDTVITALGQASILDFARESGIQISRGGTIVTDGALASSVDGIFAGGDAVSGPSIAIEAIAAGKQAARSIDEYLRGEPLSPKEEERQLKKLSEVELAALRQRVPSRNRVPMKELDPEERIKSFEEVELGYSVSEAREEAERCLASQIEGCFQCQECAARCTAQAIEYEMQDEYLDLNVGAVVFAPGYDLFDPSVQYELGYRKYPNVVNSIEFERILGATGPYQGTLLRPSDLTPPQRIAFIQCVGSRDPSHNRPYCSSVCCTYAIKEAVIAKEHSTVPLDITIFFMDIRTHGKDFDKYYERAKEESGINFVRSKVYSIESADSSGDLVVKFATEDGTVTTERFSMVVLSVGFQSSPELVELARKGGVQINPYGFCQTQPFLPMTTSQPGIFVCGAFSAPKDIPETVVQASAAAGEISALLAPARGTLTRTKEYPPERDVSGEEPRIGVFVCHCGVNIGGYLDVPEVADYARTLPNVEYAERNLFTCSQDTQEKIKKAIEEYRLNRVVVASCTPRTHEPMFRETIRQAGLNPYLFEMANIRDQCSWVHMHEQEEATVKAEDLVRMAVAKAALIEPLTPVALPVNHRALVIGGGVAGMTSALTLAEQGFEVDLIERSNVLGGITRRIHFGLEGEDIQEFLDGLIHKVQEHPRIRVYTDTWIVDVHGYVGNFTTEVMRYRGRVVEKLEHGVTIIATGAEEYKPEEYLYGKDPRVLTQLELEEELLKKAPDIVNCDNLVMIQCVGCRDENRPYCSRVCCNRAINNALRLKEMKPDMNIYILYRDVRTYGFSEKYYEEARQKGVIFVRYDLENKPRVSQRRRDSRFLLGVETYDPVLGQNVVIDADILALSAAMVPSPEANELAMLYKVPLNQDGFFLEAHVKLRPVDFATDGVFVCGLAHAPKTIEESIAQAKAAAARASLVLVKDAVTGEGIVASVNEKICTGCGICEAMCPYVAIAVDREKGVSVVNAALCKGCGTCCAACPSGAVQQRGFTREEISAALSAALAGV